MNKTAITSPELAPPVGPFSQAVKIDGFLFFSGQVAQFGGNQLAVHRRPIKSLATPLDRP